MKRISSLKARYALSALFVCLLIGPLTSHRAQTRRPPRVLTRQTDIVYSARFSPDTRTLAIARGASDTGRVELWDVETGTLRHVISGFDGPVWSVSFAPDGKSLVTASVEFHAVGLQEKIVRREGRRTAELKWWDPLTGELKHQVTLPGDAQSSLMAFYSPDGKLLATVECHYSIGSYSADLKLLDAQTGALRVKLKRNLTALALPSFQSTLFDDFQLDPHFVLLDLRRQRVAFSPDGRLLAFWNAKELRLWNSTTGAEVVKLNDFKHSLSAVAFAPVGDTLAGAITTSSSHGKNLTLSSEIRLYDPASGAVRRTLPVATQVISCMAFAPNGQQLVIGGWQNEQSLVVATLELFDIQAGSRGRIKTGDNGRVNSLALSPNGQKLTFQDDISSVNLVDTATWTIRYAFDENSGGGAASAKRLSRFLLSVKRVLALSFSADGKTVTGEIEQGGIRQWDPRTGEVKKQLGEHDVAGTIVDVSTNGATAAEVADNESVQLWDVGNGDKRIVPTSGGPIAALALSPDGQMLAIGRAGKIIVLSTATREQLRILEGHGADIRCLTFSTNGRTVAVASEDGTIQLWDLTNGQVTKTITAGGKITTLRFAPTNRVLASANEDGSVSLWDLQTGALSQELKKHSGSVNAIAFSANGDLIATGGDDRTVIIWDMATGKAQRTLKGHDVTVTSLAFSPDSSLLASGAGNALVILWDVPTGKLNRVLK